MREPNSRELQSNRLVILTDEELEILRIYHLPKMNISKEKLDNMYNKYMDKKKTDHYYQKISELENDYYYHKNSVDLICKIKNITSFFE